MAHDGVGDGRGNLNKTVATVFGATYLLVGLVGFAVTGDVPFVGEDGDPLILFDVNGLHNIVHILIGAVLLGAGLGKLGAARTANLVIGVTYTALGVLNPVLNDSAVDIIGLNAADGWLHLASGLVLTGVALFADKARARA